MPRKAVFSLSDAIAKQLAKAAHELVLSHPVEEGSRPFLAAFIRAVHGITGQLYGHHTYRKMLKLYAPDFNIAPSTQTINEVFQTYKNQVRDNGQFAVEGAEDDGQRSASSTQRRERRLAAANVVEWSDRVELARLQQMEISRLQIALQAAQARCRTAEALRESLATQLSVSQARAQMLDVHTQQQLRSIAELFDKVERIQAQADASNKHALLQVERGRSETREAKDEGDQLRRKLAAREAELKDERALTVRLRQRLNVTSA